MKKRRRGFSAALYFLWWAHPDSNREPKDYESPAPPLSYRPVLHVDYCTRKLSSQGNFIYPHCRQTLPHRLGNGVDQHGARGRPLLRVDLRLLRLLPVLGLGRVFHACLLLAPCGARPCMKKATRADGLNQRRPRRACGDSYSIVLGAIRYAMLPPGWPQRARPRMRARQSPSPCAYASSRSRRSPHPS